MTVDVAIIGGGLAGCASAYYLARAGVDVCLLEQADLNTKASGANAGSIHLQIPHETFIVEGDDWARTFGPALPLMAASIALWRGLPAELETDLEVSLGGGLLVAETEGQMAEIRRKSAIENAFDIPVEMVGRDELRALAPYLSRSMIGGAYCPLEGKANPLLTTFAFANAARSHGARIRTAAQVSAIRSEDNGFRIETNDEPVYARKVVNAAGIDAGRIAAMAGIDLTIEAHPLQVCVTAPVDALIRHLIYFAGDKLTLKQSGIGSLLIGGGWPSRLDTASDHLFVDPESVARNLAIASRVVPIVADTEIVRTWPAMVNGTADWRPILGDSPHAPGFYTAFFPWMGFTAGPIVGRVIADLILERDCGHDIAPFTVAAHQLRVRNQRSESRLEVS